MTFTRPIPFAEAVDKLGSRNPLGSQLRTGDWREMPVALSDRAFFSSTVEDVRFLENARGFLLDAVSGAKRTNERGETYYAMDRAKFVQRLQNYAVANGMGPTGTGDLQDIRSQTRLELIFDTQIKSARDYGYWKQGQDPDVLEAFPYQRFIRLADVRAPRARSERWEGVVRRKDDLDFWIMLNEDFRVPWGPWGFNSGMDVEDVAAEEAGEIIERNPVMEDVLRPRVPVRPVDRDFNEGLRASVRGMSPEARQHLQDTFGGQVRIQGDEIVFTRGGALPPPEPQPAPPAPPTPPAPAPTPAPVRNAQSAIKTIRDLALAGYNTHAELAVADAVAQLALRQSTPGKIQVKGQAAKRPQIRAGLSLAESMVSPSLYTGQTLAVRALRSRRSFYRPSTKSIHISANASASTVAHEIAHWLEDVNPRVLAASKAFLASRTAGEQPVRLRTLTGNPGYHPNEVALRDQWKDRGGEHYTGKVYPNATEILSMGVERLIHSPVRFAKEDPEFFEYIVRVLWNELP